MRDDGTAATWARLAADSGLSNHGVYELVLDSMRTVGATDDQVEAFETAFLARLGAYRIEPRCN